MKRVLYLACAAVAVAGASSVAAGSADAAASHHCAVRSDFAKVHKHQSVAKVSRELHSKGHIEGRASSGGYRSMIKSYKTCSAYSAIDISFSANPGQSLTVDNKSAVWVH